MCWPICQRTITTSSNYKSGNCVGSNRRLKLCLNRFGDRFHDPPTPEAIERVRQKLLSCASSGNQPVIVPKLFERAAALISALAAERDAATVKQLTEEDFRIAYQGYGRAIRRDQDEPYPGEPYMSMDDAARLSAELVAAQPGIDPQEVKVPRAELLAIRDALERARHAGFCNAFGPTPMGCSCGRNEALATIEGLLP